MGISGNTGDTSILHSGNADIVPIAFYTFKKQFIMIKLQQQATRSDSYRADNSKSC